MLLFSVRVSRIVKEGFTPIPSEGAESIQSFHYLLQRSLKRPECITICVNI